jgi:hypothetical protein
MPFEDTGPSISCARYHPGVTASPTAKLHFANGDQALSDTMTAGGVEPALKITSDPYM